MGGHDLRRSRDVRPGGVRALPHVSQAGRLPARRGTRIGGCLRRRGRDYPAGIHAARRRAGRSERRTGGQHGVSSARRLAASPQARAALRGRPPHVLLVVENVAIARDHRLQKQVSSLDAHGFRVTVVCRSDRDNGRFTAARVRTYRAPADAESKLGFLREYGYSFAMASWLAVRVFLAEPFDAIQVSGTPDIYFALALPCKLLGRPVVLDQRDLSPELYELRYGRRGGAVYRALCWFERRSYRAANHVITVNSSLRDKIG